MAGRPRPGFEFTLFDGTGRMRIPYDSRWHREQPFMEWISAGNDPSVREHWLIFIGHGTHDAKTTRFNLEGTRICRPSDLGQST
jgi:hypothetical protein